jgi:hypothetical protein
MLLAIPEFVFFIIFQDIDECSNESTNDCNINANCTNTPGSYNCQCHSGFSQDGKHCTGIVEYTKITSITVCVCERLEFCEIAFVLIFPDIDECSEKSNNECHTNANCTNTPGSYNCHCLNGHVGDGINCSGTEYS